MRFFANLKPEAPAELFPEMTLRKRGILSLIATEQTNAEIAVRLVIRPATHRDAP